MEITVFSKKRTTKEGKKFFSYLTTITDKNGEAFTCSVKFRESCGQPRGESCPVNIVVEKKACNLASKEILLDDGRTVVSRTLWISEWKAGSEYVDHSLDDFDF